MKIIQILLIGFLLMQSVLLGAERVYVLKGEGKELDPGFCAAWDVSEGTDKLEPLSSNSTPSYKINVKGKTVGKAVVKATPTGGAFQEKEYEVIVLHPVLKSIRYKDSHNIKSDTTGNPLVSSQKDHWTVSEQHSVAYTKNKEPKIEKIVIEMGYDLSTLTDSTPTVKLKGTYPDNGTFAEKTVPTLATEITLTDMTGTGVIADKIDYIDDFKITWQIVIDDNPAFEVKYGDDNTLKGNEMYVTGADPSGNSLLETVIHIACTKAKGQTSDSGIISGIWGYFETRAVTRKDTNITLQYYGNWSTQNVTTPDLIKYRDGQCSSWTKLFLDTLKAHGINTSNSYIMVGWRATANNTNGILVQNWRFSGTGKSGLAPVYPYINILTVGANFYAPESSSYVYQEVFPPSSIKGQNNGNTPKSFNNHQFAQIGGVYRDPSYGTSNANDRDFGLGGYYYRTQIEVDESSFGVNGIDLNGNGRKDDQNVLVNAYILKQHFTNWVAHEISNY